MGGAVRDGKGQWENQACKHTIEQRYARVSVCQYICRRHPSGLCNAPSARHRRTHLSSSSSTLSRVSCCAPSRLFSIRPIPLHTELRLTCRAATTHTYAAHAHSTNMMCNCRVGWQTLVVLARLNRHTHLPTPPNHHTHTHLIRCVRVNLEDVHKGGVPAGGAHPLRQRCLQLINDLSLGQQQAQTLILHETQLVVAWAIWREECGSGVGREFACWLVSPACAAQSTTCMPAADGAHAAHNNLTCVIFEKELVIDAIRTLSSSTLSVNCVK